MKMTRDAVLDAATLRGVDVLSEARKRKLRWIAVDKDTVIYGYHEAPFTAGRLGTWMTTDTAPPPELLAELYDAKLALDSELRLDNWRGLCITVPDEKHSND